MTKSDVHTRHCCWEHGCKYGEEDSCTVYLGYKKQESPCESCEGIMPQQIEEISQTRQLAAIDESRGWED